MTTQQRFDRLGERAWGYDPAQVDDFLDRLAAVMHTTPPAPGGHADPVAGPGTVAEPVVDPADVTDPVTAEDSAASADTAGATDADREPESAEAARTAPALPGVTTTRSSGRPGWRNRPA